MLISNFGGCSGARIIDLESVTLSNGGGKTTRVNAYIWVLTGRCIDGFEPVCTNPAEGTPTAVTLEVAGAVIQRTAVESGTRVTLNGIPVSQSELTAELAAVRFDLDLAAACANVNVLTSAALTSDDLRKLLIRAGVIDDVGKTLRADLTKVRALRKEAESYALSNVKLPVRTVEPLTDAELHFLAECAAYDTVIRRPLAATCPTCGHTLPPEVVREQTESRADALEHLEGMQSERTRIESKRDAYETESVAISDAERLIATAITARKRVIQLDEIIAQLLAQITENDARALRAELPEGVEVITERVSKTGAVSNVCTLTYNGVPLKSVNRAKRVEICVRLLAAARAKAGMQDVAPIIIDNAESVQGLDDVPNVIRFTVG